MWKTSRKVESECILHRWPIDCSRPFQLLKRYFLDSKPTTYGSRPQKWSIEGFSTLGITREITNFRKKEAEIVGN